MGMLRNCQHPLHLKPLLGSSSCSCKQHAKKFWTFYLYARGAGLQKLSLVLIQAWSLHENAILA